MRDVARMAAVRFLSLFIIGILLLSYCRQYTTNRRKIRNHFYAGDRSETGQSLLPILEIVEVIFYRSLVSTWNLFLAQSTLSIRLGGRRGLFVLHLALAFDADA